MPQPIMRSVDKAKALAGEDTICLFKMADFWEAFGPDAQAIAEACSLTLTSHKGTDGTWYPMAGFPAHTFDRYTRQLTAAGYKVAACEITE